MTTKKFSFESREFSSLEEMTDALLHEANEQIVRIDIGNVSNVNENRNYVKWRLLHLQYYFGDIIPIQIKSTYNSLWSQLYRLEHQDEYRHPYLKSLLEKIKNANV
ncbi:hypothetical protein [Aneurinibacillus aneurinilyticus]|uniref:Uncharacterized protein n=2 Tax=Aneurinibacillus aneurinilyticus TaxID=1391 RepID=A0A848CRP4_ANEAE|nr:hypothetical protein [Aneurinibacillus aneurinilyticus]ERI10003.1 hypothetical protein HMPREF0083_01936 [Aneurinibacillus aneurinilyticus ATCC 12856]MCI1692591.1 hypothetical protein [Aneurinibacillus aneurinilyticus]MED0670188.1 hypothetical protein [Aneurinibacillus aneurinilyticus]MED0705149.1 hypothetical protein [Aneurinibacillus aneurinilyticus]MED0725645.1 hypothetical protein [Aneurinibacillus aneurinilyticus]